MTKITEAQARTMIADAIRAGVTVDTLKSEAREAGEGVYSRMTRIAANMTQSKFKVAAEKVLKTFNDNEGGCAEQAGLEPKQSGKGYKIPSAVSSAKSTLLSAHKYKVEMVEEDGEPRSFSAIRTEVTEARRAEEAAGMTDNDRAVAGAVNALQELIEGIAGKNGKVEPGSCDSVAAEIAERITAVAEGFLSEYSSAQGDSSEEDEAPKAAQKTTAPTRKGATSKRQTATAKTRKTAASKKQAA